MQSQLIRLFVLTSFIGCAALLKACGTGFCNIGIGCDTDSVYALDHRVFVLSGTLAPDFGGASGADALCQAEAQSHGLVRTYKAIIGEDGQGPAQRLSFTGAVYLFTSASTSEKVVDHGNNLWSGSILRAIDRTADFQSAANTAWTGANVDGSANGRNCNNWTDQTAGFSGKGGSTNARNSNWISPTISYSCVSGGISLYCISQ